MDATVRSGKAFSVASFTSQRSLGVDGIWPVCSSGEGEGTVHSTRDPTVRSLPRSQGSYKHLAAMQRAVEVLDAGDDDDVRAKRSCGDLAVTYLHKMAGGVDTPLRRPPAAELLASWVRACYLPACRCSQYPAACLAPSQVSQDASSSAAGGRLPGPASRSQPPWRPPPAAHAPSAPVSPPPPLQPPWQRSARAGAQRACRPAPSAPLPPPTPHPSHTQVGAFLGTLLVATCQRWLTPRVSLPLMIASFGASAVLLFGAPESKMSQPRNCLGARRRAGAPSPQPAWCMHAAALRLRWQGGHAAGRAAQPGPLARTAAWHAARVALGGAVRPGQRCARLPWCAPTTHRVAALVRLQWPTALIERPGGGRLDLPPNPPGRGRQPASLPGVHLPAAPPLPSLLQAGTCWGRSSAAP
jgi:hypothetical protein